MRNREIEGIFFFFFWKEVHTGVKDALASLKDPTLSQAGSSTPIRCSATVHPQISVKAAPFWASGILVRSKSKISVPHWWPTQGQAPAEKRTRCQRQRGIWALGLEFSAMGTTQQVTLTATNFHEKRGAERQENSRDLRQTRGARVIRRGMRE